ncbi:PorP/SprF family type IX secretion system membrane protein [Algibacter sp. 2305UL17-15]|uniref:PorP/SprF family type IX secretion system membrane protein n=1 Tax=Algibacter sp. 2305UL17-15 TaxID=3231268 RepID=UPI0034598075
MNKYLIYLLLVFCTIQQFHSQEGSAVVGLSLPVRNSLKFNRYAINPTFSFVREQNRFISFTNKKQWVQFNDAPQSYLFSYSGRFKENIGAGLSLFQQDFGVLTTFGGILNFAYNVNISNDSNLTFGLNLGAYQSGISQGRVVVNTPDPTLQNIPSSFLFTVNPGINYGTTFLDFGVSINNLVAYDISNSKMIEDNPEQAIQGHIMYTGYMNSRGFFDESKFSTLFKSEFKKDQAVLSGLVMLTVPKGIWAQAGYNSLYGASAGIGLNVTENIALEYNYEQSMGNLSEFGNSHEITIAYRFKNKYRFSYGDDDEEQSVFNSRHKKVKANTISKSDSEIMAKRRIEIAAQRKAAAEAKKEQASVVNSNEKSNPLAINTSKNKDDELAKRKIEESKLKLEAEAQAKLEAEATKAKLEAEAKAKEAARLQAIEKARIEAEAKKQLEEAERLKREEATRLRLEAEAQAKLEAEAAKAKLEAQAKAKEAARLQQIEKAKADAEAKRQLEEVERLKREEATRLRLEAEAQAKLEAEATKAKLEAEAKAKEAARLQAIEKARIEAEAKKQLEEAERLKREEATRLRLEAEAQAKLEAEAAKAKMEAEAKAKEAARLQAIEKARIEAEAKKQLEEAERLKREEATRLRLEAEAQAKLEAEAAKAKLEAEAKAKEAARLQAIEKAKADAEAKKQLEETERLKAEAKAKLEAETTAVNESIPEATDATSQSMRDLTKSSEETIKIQRELLDNLSKKIDSKQNDLDDLKKENDLSEQGLYQAPKQFKSITAENEALEKVQDEINKRIEEQNIKIIELETLYITRKKKVRSKNDPVNAFYLKTIERLKSEQLKTITAKRGLEATLEDIKVATDYERKRRIRRAAYDNQEDRYIKDKAALARIKKFTDESATPLREEDFDFGEEQTRNIQIIKNVTNEDNGYYMVIAVHSDIEKRDEFVTKVVASGEKNVNFFFDVTTNKYFIYYEKFGSIGEAKNALEAKGSTPYNGKMSLVKIEN